MGVSAGGSNATTRGECECGVYVCAPRGGIERGTGAGGATADDEDIEGGVTRGRAQSAQRLSAGGEVEGTERRRVLHAESRCMSAEDEGMSKHVKTSRQRRDTFAAYVP